MFRIAPCPRPLAAGLSLAVALFAAAAPAAAEPLTFAWTAPSKATVTLDAEKRGNRVKSSMVVSVSRQPDGLLRLDYEDVTVLSVNGKPLTSPEGQAAMPPALAAITKAVPSILVNPAGQLVDFIGFDRLIEALIENTPQPEGGQGREQLRKVLSDPRMQTMMRSKAGDDWSTWVGLWAGKELAPGARTDFEAQVASGDGNPLPTHGYFENRGPVEGRPGTVRLYMEVVSDGPEFRAAIHRMLVAMIQSSGQTGDVLPAEQIEDARRVQSVETVTDPETLRPQEVTVTLSTSIKMRGEAEKSEIERKHFVFDWSAH